MKTGDHAKISSMNNAYFFDIDGTIYDSRFHSIDPLLYPEIEQRIEDGDDVWLLSSRSIFETVHLPEAFRSLPFTGIILEGGGALYDSSWNCVSSTPLDAQQVKCLADWCAQHGRSWRWSGPEDCRFERTPSDALRQMWRGLYLMVPPAGVWNGQPVCNALIFTDQEKERRELRQMFSDSALVIYERCVEIRAAGVSKEACVRALREKQGYRKVFCAGDGMNDVEMLKEADFAVSVENGCQAAKDAADLVVASPDQGGIAHWLKAQRKEEEYERSADS